MRVDTVITGGQVVTPTGTSRADVAVKDGIIVALCAPGHGLEATRVVDAAGKYVLPGVIDAHFHPVRRVWKDMNEVFQTQTASMALGGVTTAGAFCHTIVHPDDGVFESLRSAVERESFVDMFFHAAIGDWDQLQHIPRFARELGIPSFKFFMTGEGEGGRPRPELYAEGMPGRTSLFGVDEGTAFLAFAEIARLGPPALAIVHTENWKIVTAMERKLREAGRTDAAAWPDSHPNIAEEDILRRACFLASKQECPLYLVHLSTREAVEALRKMHGQGADVTGESVIHHLVFNRQVYDGPLGMTFRYVPPIREECDRLAVWQAIAEGVISCIGSDHISVRRTEKYPLAQSIWDAHGGNPGSGMILPVMLSEGVNKGRISLERVTELCSYNVARTFGLAPQKGAIAVGADADLVVVDLGKEVTMQPEAMRLEFSMYEGMTFRGWPVLTMVRGQVVMEEGHLKAERGMGRYIPRWVSP